jgi:hypothetical protein
MIGLKSVPPKTPVRRPLREAVAAEILANSP